MADLTPPRPAPPHLATHDLTITMLNPTLLDPAPLLSAPLDPAPLRLNPTSFLGQIFWADFFWRKCVSSCASSMEASDCIFYLSQTESSPCGTILLWLHDVHKYHTKKVLPICRIDANQKILELYTETICPICSTVSTTIKY